MTTTITPQEFIARIAPAAKAASNASGLSYELMLAQAAQETGWGKRVLSGTNNLFNIKADPSWHGAKATFLVPEVINGKRVMVNAEFRVYSNYEESFKDRINFLQSNPIYTNAGLFSNGTLGNFDAEAKALKSAGYATDPNYVQRLEEVFNGPTMRRSLLAIGMENPSLNSTSQNESIKNTKEVLSNTKGIKENLTDEVWNWVSQKLFGTSASTPGSISTTTNGNVTTLQGPGSSVTIDHFRNTIKIPVTTLPKAPTGNIGHPIGEVGMFSTFNMQTGERLSLDISFSNDTVVKNPLFFDLSIDTNTLMPSDGTMLGGSSNGQGLLGLGPGYKYSMLSSFVNENGIYTFASATATLGSRVGNGSLSEVPAYINQLRIDQFNSNQMSEFTDGYGLLFGFASKLSHIDYTDPLALDSGNDGIRFSSASTSFDYDGDGQNEDILWTGPTDPLLVLDVNEDGRINNGTELLSLTDEDAPLDIRTLDYNQDELLNSSDDRFNEIRIWTDRNQDGYASERELQSLRDLGIQSIDLNASHIMTTMINGRLVKGVSATYTNGSSRILWDVPFIQANTPTTPVSSVTYGNGVNKVTSGLQSALKATGINATLDLHGSGANQAIGGDGNDTLIGTDGNDWLIGGAGDDLFDGGDGMDLFVIESTDSMQNINGGAGVDTVIIADDQAVYFNLSQTNTEVVYGGYGDDVLVGGGSDNYVIDGADGDDIIVGGNADDVLSGADGEDIIKGGKGDDLIRGGRDHDRIFGGEGNDIVDGGADNDVINGESGDDVIIASGGTDSVDGGSGVDLIQLSGALEDYRFNHTYYWDIGGTYKQKVAWTIVDTKNTDGTNVDFSKGEVSNRNGTQVIKNIEKFSYMRGNAPTVMNFEMLAPLPVNDIISNVDTSQIILIPVSTLLGNDLDFLEINKNRDAASFISWVGDAVGGQVSISNSYIQFIPNPDYKGPLEFTYKVYDLFLNNGILQTYYAPVIADTFNPSQSGEAKARVILSPANQNSISDPEYIKQWYLGAVNVQTVWEMGFTGKNVDVLVLEPSGQFATSIQVADLKNYEFSGRVGEGFLDSVNHSIHATEVAGVIGAGKNGKGIVGVAYNSVLDSKSFLNGESIQAFRATLSEMRNHDVVNNSWGIDDQWDKNGLLSSSISSAVEDAARYGRDGLGSIIVFGAGNDRLKGYDASLSKSTSNPYSITVGAINRAADFATSGQNVPFSNRGTSILVSAPGSNIVSTGVLLTSADGYSFGANSNQVEGTSFAAPIVSGVIALMLEANPHLTYRNVQEILALTARKDYSSAAQNDTVWSRNSNFMWNGTGMHFSHDYGFGMVDAAAAVRMAQSWQSDSGYEQSLSNSAIAGILPDSSQQTLTFNISENVSVEKVLLNLKMGHERWSDLVVTLISPSGTKSILLDRPGFSGNKIYLDNPAGETLFNQEIMSVHFRGEVSFGTWQLLIEDKASGKAGTSEINASIEIIGNSNLTPKKYFITDEYTGGWILSPGEGVPSELNASALSKSVKIDLSGSTTGQVNGNAFTVAPGIDTLISGGGDDTLYGSALNETILGAGGNDSINGGAGHDKLVGGDGNDSLYGGGGQDLLVAGIGQDSLWGGLDSDVFLIEPLGNNSLTIIKDFSVVQNDTLIIRANNLSTQSITQSVSGSKLSLSFVTSGGVNTVTLEGVTATLTNNNLRVIREGEEVATNRETGAYLGKNIRYVSPVIRVKEILPYALESFMDEGTSAKVFEKITLPPLNFKIVNASEGFAEASPGQRIVIQSLTRGYIILDEGILAAKWSGVTPDGKLNLLIQDRYSNNGQIAYEFTQLSNTTGTEESEEIRIGAPVRSIDTSDQLWAKYAGSLQSYQIDPKQGMQGFGGNDLLYGNSLGQTIDGGSGDDTLYGDGGNDSLIGGTGVDMFMFSAGHGVDSIQDLENTDVLSFSGISSADLIETASYSSESVNSFNVNVQINTGGGSKVIFSRMFSLSDLNQESIDLYNYQLNGATKQTRGLVGTTISQQGDFIWQAKLGLLSFSTLAGDDLVYSNKSNHLTVDLGIGNDTIYALEGANNINGSDGNDRIQILAGSGNLKDTLIGGSGDDYIYAGANGSLIYGDDLQGTNSGTDKIYGGAGNDTIYGGDNSSLVPSPFLYMGSAEVLSGGEGDDIIYGQAGVDQVLGGGGNDQLDGGSDNDFIIAGTGDDIGYGGDGDDILSGGSGNDFLYGGSGNDVLSGDEGNDYLEGGEGADRIYGGDGDDTIVGGAGDDYIEGGAGLDVVHLTSTSGNDTVSGTSGVDIIEFENLSSKYELTFAINKNGSEVKLSWGSTNSVTLIQYSVDTKIKFSNGTTNTLRSLFNSNGYFPDTTFEFLNIYDTQLTGDPSKVNVVWGGDEDDQIYGGPRLSTDPAYAYVLGRGGDDSLAVGASGGALDGGYGNDSFFASNGTVIARDTYNGGKDRIVMPAGITPYDLIFSRVKNPLEYAELDQIADISGYKPTGFERLLADSENTLLTGIRRTGRGYDIQQLMDPNLFVKYSSTFGSSGDPFYGSLASTLTNHLDTLRVQSKDGKFVTDIVGYFDEGELKNDVEKITFSRGYK